MASLIIILLTSTTASFSANTKLDTLLTEIKQGGDKQTMAEKYLLVSVEYIDQKKDKEAKLYIDKAEEITIADKNSVLYGRTILQKGVYFMLQNDFVSALDNLIKARKIFREQKTPGHYADAVSNIGLAHAKMGNLPKAKQFFREAIKFRLVTTDSIKLCKSINGLGVVYLWTNSYDSANKYMFQAYEIWRRNQSKDPDGYLNSVSNMSIISQYLGDYDKAIEYQFEYLRAMEEKGDKVEMASAYENIAQGYQNVEEYEKCIRFAKMAIEIYKELDMVEFSANAYNAYGLSLQGQLKFDDAILVFDTAYQYYLKQDAEMRDGNYEISKANPINNIGICHLQMMRFPQALEYFQKSLKLREATGNIREIAGSYNNIANTYLALKQYKNAEDYFLKSQDILEEINFLPWLKQVYHGLSEVNDSLGNYRKAYSYYKQYNLLDDSIRNVQVSKNANDLEIQYSTEKKEQKIKLLETEKNLQDSEIKRNKLITMAIGAGGLLMLVLVFISYRAYRQKRKSNQLLEHQNELIHQQKEAIESQKELVEEINKEMVDSITYAKRIQNAILPTHEYVEEVLPDSFVLFKPKDIVSGDFYIVEKIGDKVLFGAIDCTGHGVPGALMSIVGHNGLTRAIGENQLDTPAKILDFLHHNLSQTFSKGQTRDIKDGMDAALCTINYKTLELEFAGAMNPLYIVNHNELKETKGDKMAIGSKEKDSNYTNHQFQLEKGDAVYIFSDGFADQFGGDKGKKFKYKPFKDLLLSIYAEPAKQQHEKLDTTFEGWKGNLQQIDDVCIIGVRL